MDGLAFLSEAANFIDDQKSLHNEISHSPIRKKKVKLNNKSIINETLSINTNVSATNSQIRTKNPVKIIPIVRTESISKAISRSDSINAGTPRSNR